MSSPMSTPTYEKLEGPVIDLNCGDGRTPVDRLVKLYGKLLGGRLALPWDAMVMQEYTEPDSVQQTLSERDAEFSKYGYYDRANINGGVHSDEHCEGKGAIRINVDKKEGPIGCGRWQHAKKIAQTAFTHIGPIIEELKQELPDLIEGHEEEARALAKANADLAERTLPDGQPILDAGRKIVIGAIENGAHDIVLAGDHDEEDAGLNTQKGETNNNLKTSRHFGVDGWIEADFFEANREDLPFDSSLVLLQAAIISKATRLVLDKKSSIDRVR